MYSVWLVKEDMCIRMDCGLDFFTACEFAEIYKKKNPTAIFNVINDTNNDIVYQL